MDGMHAMDEPRELALVFVGGGSGGHLHPGLAVAERARERFPAFHALFLHSGLEVERRVLATSDFPEETLPITKPSGGARAWIRYSLQSFAAVRALRGRLKKGGFDAVVGLGGYASFPGVLAARRAGLPVVLLEQNEVPGRVNRFLSRFVEAVSCPSAASASRLEGRAEVTGNPVRLSVLEAAAHRRVDRAAGEKRRVLVFGGSQGARGLNAALRRALDGLEDLRERIAWDHVTGEADRESLEEYYRSRGWEARVSSYSVDLPRRMAGSDMVICRAGGTSVAELTVVGVPSLLVPYPHHGDQHQLKNARALEAAGGCRVLPQEEIRPETLRQALDDVLFSTEKLGAMATSCRGLARPDAADAVINLLIEVKRSCRLDSVSSSS
ncbi:MAG: UDP-N-acetylglucosamine--N-acetylmuramyl-(pentapeptide) pyrophosphoryl-undecaprenol N-acetylglucosamine transferase [Planctomycetota bacterium]|nr:UDP-N-acetylglucosamine--N-acetylmuramyl-(pentapeptide) pyrophosphoryl-undecaprenol N-acetylglucosamine transferase [Planctomycetota bacterium]